MKKLYWRWIILVLIALVCYLGIKELRKGHTIYFLRIDKAVTLEFVYGYDWEVNASIQAIIHKSHSRPIKSASIDWFTPGLPSPKYDFIKSKQGLIGVFRKNEPNRIVFLFDLVELTHVPFVGLSLDRPRDLTELQHQQYKKEWDMVDIMAEKFHSEYPGLYLPVGKYSEAEQQIRDGENM